MRSCTIRKEQEMKIDKRTSEENWNKIFHSRQGYERRMEDLAEEYIFDLSETLNLDVKTVRKLWDEAI